MLPNRAMTEGAEHWLSYESGKDPLVEFYRSERERKLPLVYIS